MPEESSHDFNWTSFEELRAALTPTSNSQMEERIEVANDTLCYAISDAEELAEGTIEYYQVGNTMRIVVMDCVFEQTRTVHVFDPSWVRFNFSLNLHIDMRIGEVGPMALDSPSWRIIHLPEGIKTIERFRGGEKLRWATVCVRPERLTEICGMNMDNLPCPLGSLSGASADLRIYRSFELTNRLAALTAEILNNRFEGALRVNFVVNKATELLLLALNHVIYLPDTESFPLSLGPKDMQKVKEARCILMENLADVPSVRALCRRVGLNRNKLYYGFRSQFGMTISEFVKAQRLAEGHRLITETDLSIAEIAHSVGFLHQCNFSTAIKANYGLAPTQLRHCAMAEQP